MGDLLFRHLSISSTLIVVLCSGDVWTPPIAKPNFKKSILFAYSNDENVTSSIFDTPVKYAMLQNLRAKAESSTDPPRHSHRLRSRCSFPYIL